jgi:2,4-dienoyl-CoA reductase-like NADH-dependent reductase (Old Yellow Enzyme family)
VDRLKWAADTIKPHGSCFIVQLWHFGGQGYGTTLGHQPWAPSPIPPMPGGAIPHEMTRDEIKEVIDGFASAAVMCQKAGCDGVELHGAHSYLICQFMSPYTNKRTDEYGDSMEGRMRFVMETIDAVRSAVGSDYAMGIRVNGDEFNAEGYNIEDMKIMAPMMADTGKIDWINVSTGGIQALAPMYIPIGHSVYLASAVKGVVDIPVCAIGRINDPVQAEDILQENHADVVCMNRALICDPELPKKAREGRTEEIRKCLACSEGCWQRLSEDRHPMGISCTYNPTVGMETLPGWLELIPAPAAKKVMVVGGGPAGLEAARVARARGHEVSIWDKSDDWGGWLPWQPRHPAEMIWRKCPAITRFRWVCWAWMSISTARCSWKRLQGKTRMW